MGCSAFFLVTDYITAPNMYMGYRNGTLFVELHIYRQVLIPQLPELTL